jgi:hypothetical protein
MIATGLLAASCGGNCLFLCAETVRLALVDEQDAGVPPGTGRLAFDGTLGSFDCAAGTTTGPAIICEEFGLQVQTNNQPKQLSITVKELDGGREFAGDVPLAFVVSAVRCTPCRVAGAKITLR